MGFGDRRGGRPRHTQEAAAAGYVVASTVAPGVGVHWVKWSLIDEPFDPRHRRCCSSMYTVAPRCSPGSPTGCTPLTRRPDRRRRRPLASALGSVHRQRVGRPRGSARSRPVCGRLLRRQRPLDAPHVGRARLSRSVGCLRRHEPAAVPTCPCVRRHLTLPERAIAGDGRVCVHGQLQLVRRNHDRLRRHRRGPAGDHASRLRGQHPPRTGISRRSSMRSPPDPGGA